MIESRSTARKMLAVYDEGLFHITLSSAEFKGGEKKS
jgi:hypothetical protein